MKRPTTPLPDFYYSGSKRHGLKSDASGIEFHLMRIPERLREYACKEYQKIYLKNIYGKFPNDRRSLANGWLVEFCNKKGISVDEMKEKIKNEVTSENYKKAADEMVDRMKRAIKSGRKTIF